MGTTWYRLLLCRPSTNALPMPTILVPSESPHPRWRHLPTISDSLHGTNTIRTGPHHPSSQRHRPMPRSSDHTRYPAKTRTCSGDTATTEDPRATSEGGTDHQAGTSEGDTHSTTKQQWRPSEGDIRSPNSEKCLPSNLPYSPIQHTR